MHPVRAGFRAVVRQPAVIAGEIAWRWAFGAAAWALIVLTLRHIFAGVDVSEAEYLMARRSDAFLMADACARVLVQVLPQAARAALILIPALTVFWIAAATFGRAATLRALIKPVAPQGTASLFMLNLLRAVCTLATVIAFFGTVILVSRAFPPTANRAGVTVIWILLAGLVGLCWSVVNWFLSLAAIFVVRDRRGTWAAIADSISLSRRFLGTYAATVSWFGFFRGLALITAPLLALFAAAAAPGVAAGVILSAMAALVYFAVADFLYIARLAAFLHLLTPGDASRAAEPLAGVPLAGVS